MIRKSTNLLLTRTLSNCLQNVIKRKNVGLTEVRLGAEHTNFQGRAQEWGLVPWSSLQHLLEVLVWSISVKYLVGDRKRS